MTGSNVNIMESYDEAHRMLFGAESSSPAPSQGVIPQSQISGLDTEENEPIGGSYTLTDGATGKSTTHEVPKKAAPAKKASPPPAAPKAETPTEEKDEA